MGEHCSFFLISRGSCFLLQEAASTDTVVLRVFVMPSSGCYCILTSKRSLLNTPPRQVSWTLLSPVSTPPRVTVVPAWPFSLPWHWRSRGSPSSYNTRSAIWNNMWIPGFLIIKNKEYQEYRTSGVKNIRIKEYQNYQEKRIWEI